MSVVIVGGNDRMVRQYKSICKDYQCKVKVFTQMSGDMRARIGTPDLIVLFTGTVSHKMAQMVARGAQSQTHIARCHSSSSSTLKNILAAFC